MAGAITKGYTFTSTEEVTHTKLHTLVDSATIANVDQTNIVANSGLVVRSAASPTDTDALHYDTDDNLLKVYDGSAWQVVGGFVDRGDPSTVDYAIGDLTEDGNYVDLDLSSIVPTGAVAVLLAVQYTASAINKISRFRKKGSSNTINLSTIRSQVANQVVDMDIIVGLDSNRVIEYALESTETTACNITVKGWWF